MDISRFTIEAGSKKFDLTQNLVCFSKLFVTQSQAGAPEYKTTSSLDQ